MWEKFVIHMLYLVYRKRAITFTESWLEIETCEKLTSFVKTYFLHKLQRIEKWNKEAWGCSVKGRVGDVGKTVQAGHILKIHNSKVQAPQTSVQYSHQSEAPLHTTVLWKTTSLTLGLHWVALTAQHRNFLPVFLMAHSRERKQLTS